MWVWISINNKNYHIDLEQFPATITLNSYIRNYAQLPGTKFMCLQGGCGSCIVVASIPDPVTGTYRAVSVNSCLVLLHVCNKWRVTTIEGIGNRKKGYHPIQKRLASSNGSQCGYCSPGMVMTMYGLLQSSFGNLTKERIEKSFGGNLCRCTGYRPILDAMKSFASDSDFEFVCDDLCADIEDLGKECKPEIGCLQKCGNVRSFVTSTDGKMWYYPSTLTELFQTFQQIGKRDYMLSAGNTAHGLYSRDPLIDVFIDINSIPDLHALPVQSEKELVFAANVTISEFIDVLRKTSSKPGFEYLRDVADHAERVATLSVRNIGTIAGNLSIKHAHNEFPSDIFLLLNAVGATLHIASGLDQEETASLTQYLHIDMNKKVITKFSLPHIDGTTCFFRSYKVAKRSDNATSYVNGAFLLKMNDSIVSTSHLGFGGISPNFNEAEITSSFLTGKPLFDEDTVKNAVRLLALELNPSWQLPQASPEYRRKLAIGLFFKFALNICPSKLVLPKFQTGAFVIERPLSSGTQNFTTNKERWPLTKPIIKLDALTQCAGEAIYMNDMPELPGQVWGAFVLAYRVNATIAKIDASAALSIPGVVAFLSAKDIPGLNSFVTIGFFEIHENEEVFCEKRVNYCSQPAGVILADSLELAKYAATKVRIIYEEQNISKIKNFEDVIKEKFLEDHEIADGGNRVQSYIKMAGQYHFSMETLTTICVPKEGDMEVYSTTQWMHLIKTATAAALKVPENSLALEVRRLGGTFGMKISRTGIVTVASALACKVLNRPVRFVMSLESNMDCVGKRTPMYAQYNVHFDQTGKVRKADVKVFADCGSSRNELSDRTIKAVKSVYEPANWNVKVEAVKTDAPSNTFCRCPDAFNGIATGETIMEHIARATGLDPLDVRLANTSDSFPVKKFLKEFAASTEYRKRKDEINEYNAQNRWRKRGIALSAMRYELLHAKTHTATVAIYHSDGTVAISHGGSSFGQGLNTRVVQVAAHTLGIPIEMIVVRPANDVNGANNFATFGSVGNGNVAYATKSACEILLERIKPIREKLKNPSWVELIEQCYAENVNLVACSSFKRGDIKDYYGWGLAVSEVEIDVLTGDWQLNRVDIWHDTGSSLNPLLDVGQVEGAFVMGLGYWLSEELIYDRETGRLLTNSTNTYKIPVATDIPVDFRVTLKQMNPEVVGFLGSKACNESGVCLAVCVIFALRHAIDSARRDAGIKEKWYHLGGPTTKETILLACASNINEYSLTPENKLETK